MLKYGFAPSCAGPDWKNMKLRDLFSDDAAIEPRAEAVEVRGLALDSRAVKPGDLFWYINHDTIPDLAASRRAVHVVDLGPQRVMTRMEADERVVEALQVAGGRIGNNGR